MKLGHEPFILYNNNEIDKNAISEYNLTHYFVGYLCQIQREASLKCRFSKLAWKWISDSFLWCHKIAVLYHPIK